MPAHYVCRAKLCEQKTEVCRGVFWVSTGELKWHRRERISRSLGRFLMVSTGEEGPQALHPVLSLFPCLSSNQGHARDDGLWGQHLPPNEMNEKCPQDALPFTAGWGWLGSWHYGFFLGDVKNKLKPSLTVNSGLISIFVTVAFAPGYTETFLDSQIPRKGWLKLKPV